MFNFCIKICSTVAQNLEEQIYASSRFNINNLETEDSFKGTRIAELNGRELEKLRRLLIDNNKKIVLLDSSLDISDISGYAKLFRNAHLLGVENIRAGIKGSLTGDKDIENLTEVLKMGKSYGIGVLFENDRNAAGSGVQELAPVYSKLPAGVQGIIFNPLEYAALKKHPFFHVFYNSRLKPAIKFLRVNDGLFEDGCATLPGMGNAELKELASALLARSFKGYFSFVPYMPDNSFEVYREVISRFKEILKAM